MAGEENATIGHVAAATGYSVIHLRRLADAGEIPVHYTAGGQRRFDLARVQEALTQRPKAKGKRKGRGNLLKTRFSKRYLLAALREDEVWKEVSDELHLDRNAPAWNVAPYSFTEMLNNAIDHSQGTHVEVTFHVQSNNWHFEIEDDGIGAFANIRKHFKLENELEAVGELTKGKRTTFASAHTGEGIFFTSKVVQLFTLESNGVKYKVNNKIHDYTIEKSAVLIGTKVTCTIDKETTVRFEEVTKMFTTEYNFTKTAPVIKLFEIGEEFLSRSEAKRLLVGLEKFEEINFDYRGVIRVGQGFADEIYRVWQSQFPNIRISSLNMIPEVEFIVKRAAQSQH